jgi:hypothetical protein
MHLNTLNVQIPQSPLGLQNHPQLSVKSQSSPFLEDDAGPLLCTRPAPLLVTKQQQ